MTNVIEKSMGQRDIGQHLHENQQNISSSYEVDDDGDVDDYDDIDDEEDGEAQLDIREDEADRELKAAAIRNLKHLSYRHSCMLRDLNPLVMEGRYRTIDAHREALDLGFSELLDPGPVSLLHSLQDLNGEYFAYARNANEYDNGKPDDQYPTGPYYEIAGGLPGGLDCNRFGLDRLHEISRELYLTFSILEADRRLTKGHASLTIVGWNNPAGYQEIREVVYAQLASLPLRFRPVYLAIAPEHIVADDVLQLILFLQDKCWARVRIEEVEE